MINGRPGCHPSLPLSLATIPLSWLCKCNVLARLCQPCTGFDATASHLLQPSTCDAQPPRHPSICSRRSLISWCAPLMLRGGNEQASRCQAQLCRFVVWHLQERRGVVRARRCPSLCWRRRSPPAAAGTRTSCARSPAASAPSRSQSGWPTAWGAGR